MKIGAVSLGCDKNRVDTEKMLARLVKAGHTLVGHEEDADVIIVNTCAFTDDAKNEAIDEILSAVEYGKKGKKIIVTGCLPKRYLAQLQEEFPEVDAFLGVADYDGISKAVERVAAGEKYFECIGADTFFSDRILTTPYHYAYLKIADGCDNHCTYCAIPSIRGKYRSETMNDLLNEAQKLSDDGVKELILVAQDVTRYGIDFDGRSHLKELVQALEKLDFEWIRLLYLEPEMVDDELINFVKTEEKVVDYMDVPLQHVSSTLLKRMNRHTNYNGTVSLVRKIKEAGITLRTSFIAGFPGETEEQFNELQKFVLEEKIDYAGFFAYSREEGTAADRLDGHLEAAIKQKRAEKLRKIEEKIIKIHNKDKIGKVFKVLYDDIDYGKQCFVGRAYFQAPDIDNVILFSSDEEVQIGGFYNVLITGTDGVDLVGRVVK